MYVCVIVCMYAYKYLSVIKEYLNIVLCVIQPKNDDDDDDDDDHADDDDFVDVGPGQFKLTFCVLQYDKMFCMFMPNI